MTTEDEWIDIKITPNMLEKASTNVKKYDDRNIFGGEYYQKLAGELGRFSLRQFLNEKRIDFEEDTHIGGKDEFDFIINKMNVSLKTQLVKYIPRQRWRCEVNINQLGNPCDYYLFAKANITENRVWLVGIISKQRFEEEGILRKKGTVLRDNVKEWAVKESKKDVPISALDSIEDILG